MKRTMFSCTGDRHNAVDLNMSRPDSITKGLEEYVLQLSRSLKGTEVLEISYLRVLNKNADNPETILDVLSWLHEEFQIGSTVNYLLVAGDEKTYSHMVQLKSEYGEAPDTVIYDGMFIIRTIPIPNTTMEDYVKLLLNRFVKCYLEKGVNEIHLIFDHPRTSLHPKCIEHEQRDKYLNMLTTNSLMK